MDAQSLKSSPFEERVRQAYLKDDWCKVESQSQAAAAILFDLHHFITGDIKRDALWRLVDIAAYCRKAAEGLGLIEESLPADSTSKPSPFAELVRERLAVIESNPVATAVRRSVMIAMTRHVAELAASVDDSQRDTPLGEERVQEILLRIGVDAEWYTKRLDAEKKGN